MITRRLALFRIGASSAVATVAAAPLLSPKSAAPAQSQGRFETPADYLAAMHAIGWKAVAIYQRLPSGAVRRMGVHETCHDRDHMARTWTAFHAIQMRTPVQCSADLPQGDWWKSVWQHLYDTGLREVVGEEATTTTKCVR